MLEVAHTHTRTRTSSPSSCSVPASAAPPSLPEGSVCSSGALSEAFSWVSHAPDAQTRDRQGEGQENTWKTKGKTTSKHTRTLGVCVLVMIMALCCRVTPACFRCFEGLCVGCVTGPPTSELESLH